MYLYKILDQLRKAKLSVLTLALRSSSQKFVFVIWKPELLLTWSILDDFRMFGIYFFV